MYFKLISTADEESAKEEAKRNMQDSGRGYSNAEVVVKLGGWDPNYSKSVAQAVLSALKCLILADKDLPGTLHFITMLPTPSCYEL